MSTDDMPALPEPTFAEVVAFLDGAGPLRGVYFGQKPPGECAAFWWREHLRVAVAQRDEQITQLAAGAADQQRLSLATIERLHADIAALRAELEALHRCCQAAELRAAKQRLRRLAEGVRLGHCPDAGVLADRMLDIADSIDAARAEAKGGDRE